MYKIKQNTYADVFYDKIVQNFSIFIIYITFAVK